jgi:hypothetical protein
MGLMTGIVSSSFLFVSKLYHFNDNVKKQLHSAREGKRAKPSKFILKELPAKADNNGMKD